MQALKTVGQSLFGLKQQKKSLKGLKCIMLVITHKLKAA